MYVCMNVCMYVCMYLCMYICICIYHIIGNTRGEEFYEDHELSYYDNRDGVEGGMRSRDLDAHKPPTPRDLQFLGIYLKMLISISNLNLL